VFGKAGASVIPLVNLRSRQLFLIFTGNAHRLMMNSTRFLQITGIAAHNILIFRDPYRAGYQQGISEAVPSLDSLVEHIREEISLSFSHVTDVFSIGTSAGGCPAIYCGHLVDSKAIWCFGCRICEPTTVRDRDAIIKGIIFRALGKQPPKTIGPQTFTRYEIARIRETLTHPEIREQLWKVSEDPQTVLDQEMLLKLVHLVRNDSSKTALYLYYSPQNRVDEWVAHAFAGIANVRFAPVHSKSDTCGIFGRASSHEVVRILYEEGLLGGVFREYI